MGKNRRVKQKLLWLQELKLRKKLDRECQNFDDFWKDFCKLSDHANIMRQAAAIDTDLKTDIDERTKHNEALKFQKEEAKKKLKTIVGKKKNIKRFSGNHLTPFETLIEN